MYMLIFLLEFFYNQKYVFFWVEEAYAPESRIEFSLLVAN
jgi:hypothetical protein